MSRILKNLSLCLCCASMAGALMLFGCSGGSGSGESLVPEIVSGTASNGSAYVGPVSLKDYRGKAIPSVTSSSSGAFFFDVTGLTAPYFIQAGSMSSVAIKEGTTNVNPFTDVVARSAAGGSDPAAVFSNMPPNRTTVNSIKTNLFLALTNFNNQLTPLYAKYNITTLPDFLNGSITIYKGVDELFKDIKVSVTGTSVIITSASTNTPVMTGSFYGTRFILTPNASAIATLPGPTATVADAGDWDWYKDWDKTGTVACDAGFASVSTSTGAQVMCPNATITTCVDITGNSAVRMYHVVGLE